MKKRKFTDSGRYLSSGWVLDSEGVKTFYIDGRKGTGKEICSCETSRYSWKLYDLERGLEMLPFPCCVCGKRPQLKKSTRDASK